MYGNLKAFAGHDAYNEYAHHLRELGEPMLPHGGRSGSCGWSLIVALVVHVYSPRSRCGAGPARRARSSTS